MANINDLSGQRFDKLIVIKRVENNKHGKSRWLCLCDCNNKTIVIGSDLKNRHTKSCGCFQKEKAIISNTIHGHNRYGKPSKTYNAWANMLKRRTNLNNKSYKNYGGRGIKICDRWLKFENFLEDIGEIPEKLTLDRIDNNGDYSLKNCKLSTMREQSRNKRDNKFFTINNKTQCLKDWAKEYKINYKTLHARLKIWNCSIEEALKGYDNFKETK